MSKSYTQRYKQSQYRSIFIYRKFHIFPSSQTFTFRVFKDFLRFFQGSVYAQSLSAIMLFFFSWIQSNPSSTRRERSFLPLSSELKIQKSKHCPTKLEKVAGRKIIEQNCCLFFCFVYFICHILITVFSYCLLYTSPSPRD